MIIHIVKNNERISDILNFYNIVFDDLRVNNLHITDFDNLKPGMKLKIPNINQNTSQILSQSEPLVSNYYENIEPNQETLSDENKAVNDLTNNNEIENPKKDKTGFRGINFIRPKNLFNLPKMKRSIYPHFDKKNDKK